MAFTEVLAELAVNLRLDSSAFARGSSAAAASAKKLEGRMQGFRQRIGGVTGALGGLAGMFTGGLLVGGASALAGKLVELGKGALEHAASLHAESQQLGVTTDDLQRYRFAAGQVGIEQDKMDMVLRRLSKSIGNVANGLAGPAKKAFEMLGINVRDSNGHIKTAGEILPELAGAFAKIPDPATKAALAVALFNRSGQDALPLLNKGAAGVNSLVAAADRSGVVISPALIERAHQLEVRFVKLKEIIETKVSVGLLTALSGIATLADKVASRGSSIDVWLKNLQARADAFDRRMGTPTQQQFVNSLGIGEPSIAKFDKMLADLTARAEKVDQRLGIPSQKTFWNSLVADITGAADGTDKNRARLIADFDDITAKVASMPADFERGWRRIEAATSSMVTQVEGWLKGKLSSAMDWASRKAHEVADHYKEMYDRVVGHSYVPDMVQGIADEFGRLGQIMVDPSVAATDKVGAAFQSLQGIIAKVLGRKTGGIFSMISQMVSAFAPLVGSLFGGAASSSASFGSLVDSGIYDGVDFGGFLSRGGPVVPGKSYVVGENGPEYVRFGARGYVTPGAGAPPPANDVTVNQTFQFEGVAVTRDEFVQGLSLTKVATVQAVRELSRRRR